MDKKTKLDLKSQAHALKPFVIIGGNGLTEKVQAEINCALDSHELIKIRVNAETKEDRQTMAQTICKFQEAELIAAIGHVITIYRKSEDKEND